MTAMTGQKAIAYIHTFQWQKHQPGLHRIRQLLHALGDPQKQLRFVHVAGTNGKGSTCACIASVLEAAGYRVGLNTSPYLVTFHERIQVNGEMISDQALADLTERVRPAAEAMEEHPTEFELITAIALLYFLEQRCDVVVLEVGMGGGLDASNVIDTPEAVVITAMGLDHTAQLGPTLADIAAAKAGIVKPGGAVVSCGGCPEADAVIRRVCRDQGAALREADFSRIENVTLSLDGAAFDLAPYGRLRLPLAGTYQVRNAAVAVTALEVLADKGWNISGDDLRRGLAAVSWPGRMEVLRREGPAFLLDGAHNPHGIAAAAESLRVLFPDRKPVLLVGAMADKDVDAMAEELAPLAAAFVTVAPDNPRAMDAAELRRRLLPWGVRALACGSVAEGVRTAMDLAGPEGAVCALGSLYFSGDVRRAVESL